MEEGKMTVRAVERALDILLCFRDKGELGLTEIAQKVDLHKSTVHRLLATLEGKGFISRLPESEKYRLGFRIWELSENLSQSDDPAVVLIPEMERLRDILGETVSLYVRDGKERVRVQSVQSKQTIRRVAPVGMRFPLYAGASSKILIAYADEKVREEILQDPEWPATIDRQLYLKQLEEIRKQGYATSVQEREAGVAAVAAPIFDRSHKLVAALAVSGPSNRMTEEVMKQYAPTVMEAAKRMGQMLK